MPARVLPVIEDLLEVADDEVHVQDDVDEERPSASTALDAANQEAC